MDFDLPQLGKVSVSDTELTLNCQLSVDFSTFGTKIGRKFDELNENIKEILKSAILTQKDISINEIEKMELNVFFMSISVDLNQIVMKDMRICGAAHFIPPKDKNE
jgi:hypothetical protein